MGNRTRALSMRIIVFLIAVLIPCVAAEAANVRGHSPRGGRSHGSHSGWYSGHSYAYTYGYYGYPYAYGGSYYPYGGYPGYPGGYYGYRHAPNVAYIDTDIYPEETRVFVDGKPVGTTDDFDGFPRYLPVTPGRHQLTFKAPGRRVVTRSVRVPRGALVQLDFTLPRLGDDRSSDPRIEEDIDIPDPPPGQMEPADEPGDEESEGELDLDEPDPDSDDPDMDDEDGEDEDTDDEDTDLEEDADEEVEDDEDADDPGFINIRVDPSDASVYLDGELLGRLHGELRVEPGVHKVEAVRPGYRPRSKRIVIGAGQRLTVDLDLQKTVSTAPPR